MRNEKTGQTWVVCPAGVDDKRFELLTLRTSSECSSQLS